MSQAELVRDLGRIKRTTEFEKIRLVQAERYWASNFGKNLGYQNLSHYLSDIPEVPKSLQKPNLVFDQLILVEPRLSIKRTCSLMNIFYDPTLPNIVALNDHYLETANPNWIRVRMHRLNDYPAGRYGSLRSGFDVNVKQGLASFFIYDHLYSFEGVSFLGSVFAGSGLLRNLDGFLQCPCLFNNEDDKIELTNHQIDDFNLANELTFSYYRQ